MLCDQTINDTENSKISYLQEISSMSIRACTLLRDNIIAIVFFFKECFNKKLEIKLTIDVQPSFFDTRSVIDSHFSNDMFANTMGAWWVEWDYWLGEVWYLDKKLPIALSL